MSQCHVWMVRATISSSVRISDVKEIATMCTNSDSNSSRAPYMMVLPAKAAEAGVPHGPAPSAAAAPAAPRPGLPGAPQACTQEGVLLFIFHLDMEDGTC